MKRLAVIALLLFALRPAPVRALETPDLRPEDFGAVADDALDDRVAIQAALNAASVAGGGTVRLGPGEYRVRVVAAYGFGGTSGYQGLVVPPQCTLTGAGPDQTHIIVLAAVANGN